MDGEESVFSNIPNTLVFLFWFNTLVFLFWFSDVSTTELQSHKSLSSQNLEFPEFKLTEFSTTKNPRNTFQKCRNCSFFDNSVLDISQNIDEMCNVSGIAATLACQAGRTMDIDHVATHSKAPPPCIHNFKTFKPRFQMIREGCTKKNYFAPLK